MKALLLAAGRGSRLGALTGDCPKPMLPVGGLPILEHAVRLLARHGFDDLVINLHYRPERIRAHFGDGRGWGVRIAYSLETELQGTAGAARRVAAWLDRTFLVYYGDNLTNFDLTDLWQAHRRLRAAATLGLLWMDEPTTRGIVGLAADGRVERFLEKPTADQVFPGYLVNAGVYVLEPAVLRHVPGTGPNDFGQDVFPRLLADGEGLYGHRLQGQLYSTDTPERYAEACRAVDSGRFALPEAWPARGEDRA
ncbi:MAG: NDP-sugar synthase [Candidatus Latescibacterota bacterium]